MPFWADAVTCLADERPSHPSLGCGLARHTKNMACRYSFISDRPAGLLFLLFRRSHADRWMAKQQRKEGRTPPSVQWQMEKCSALWSMWWSAAAYGGSHMDDEFSYFGGEIASCYRLVVFFSSVIWTNKRMVQRTWSRTLDRRYVEQYTTTPAN